MKRKGFTLIELLAVIMVLAIIALISTPIILKVIEKAEKGSFEDSAYGVVDAAKIYYANLNLDEKGKEETFVFPEDTKLKLSGKKPTIGSVKLEENGKVALAISNGKWCAIKDTDEEKLTIQNYNAEECRIPGTATPESCFTVSGNTITGYKCASKDVIIPSVIKGISIENVSTAAFQNKGLIKVEIPNSVVSIGAGAFQGNKLTSVTIPDSVTNMGIQAFHKNELKSVILSKNLKELSFNVFCTNQLTDVIIPEGVTTIGGSAFQANKLRSVSIPNTVSNIGDAAFSTNILKEVIIPSSVTSIGAKSFSGNVRGMKLTINKPNGSITGSPWGADSVEWVG